VPATGPTRLRDEGQTEIEGDKGRQRAREGRVAMLKVYKQGLKENKVRWIGMECMEMARIGRDQDRDSGADLAESVVGREGSPRNEKYPSGVVHSCVTVARVSAE
jgi:hypothetical protein